jgi:serine/threonine protein kinase
MPNLSYIEKVWITFQLLVAVNNLSSLNLVHGDLKPGNILLTSNLSVYLSDFATYKKAYIYIDDIASYTYYYGSNNSADKGGCYLAPERLIERGEKRDDNKSEPMDVFSLGVIIAELFIEKNLFNFSSLLNYKKGNNDLINVDKILLEIENEKIRKLIYDMIKINPEERINISDALNYFANEICPISMKGYIFQFNAMINSTIFWKPDLYVGHIYRYWVSIWKCLFGIDSEPEPLFQHLNLEIANKILLNDPFEKTSRSVFKNNEKGELFVDGFKLNFYPKNGKIISELSENKNIFKEKDNEKCVFIIIDYLLQAMEYSKYDSSKLLAMEMVRNLSKTVDDISKL